LINHSVKFIDFPNKILKTKRLDLKYSIFSVVYIYRSHGFCLIVA